MKNELTPVSFEKKLYLRASKIGVWRSWLAYLHGVQVVGSSSLLTPTFSNKKAFLLMLVMPSLPLKYQTPTLILFSFITPFPDCKLLKKNNY